jgi:hypothetical protein
MPDVQYNSDELRTGGTHASAASDAAQRAAGTLQGAPAGSPFGDVNGGDAFHGAVTQAQQHHAVNATTTAQNMGSAAQRAAGTAGLADDNTAETTKLAPRSSQASQVSGGM